MGGKTDKHRPLLSGVEIHSGVHNQLVGEGTLTGLAYRKDGTKLLVTCQHTLAGRGR